MDILEKKQHYIVLFDCYENLLTDKQRQYFKDYYFEDMSLSEISQEYGVSRNAVFDQLNKVYNSLEQYEEKLGLFEKYEKRQNLYNKLQKQTIDAKTRDIAIDEIKLIQQNI